MLTEYEAVVLMTLRASDNGSRPNRPATRNNRIAVIFLVLCLLSAAGLLHWTVSGRAEYQRADHVTSTKIPGDNLCAMRDARFLLQLDQHPEQGNVLGEKLYAAYVTMLRARTACAAGRQNEGLKLYDSVFGPTQTSE